MSTGVYVCVCVCVCVCVGGGGGGGGGVAEYELFVTSTCLYALYIKFYGIVVCIWQGIISVISDFSCINQVCGNNYLGRGHFLHVHEHCTFTARHTYF